MSIHDYDAESRADQERREFIEEQKARTFDMIMDTFLDVELNYQKRRSLIADDLAMFRDMYVHN